MHLFSRRTLRAPSTIAAFGIPMIGVALFAASIMVSPAAAQPADNGSSNATQSSPSEDFAAEFARRFRDDDDTTDAQSSRRPYDPYFDDDDERGEERGDHREMEPSMGPPPRAADEGDRDAMSGRRGDESEERERRSENSRETRPHNGCGDRMERRISRLLDRMERLTRPTGEQQQAFEKLRDAAGKAIEISRGACPTERALTPSGRLAAAEKRLETLLEAIRTVRPALDDFYRTLSEEQKARFYAAPPPRPGERWRAERRRSLGDGRLDAWRDEMRRRWRERWNDEDDARRRRDMSRDDWQRRRDHWRDDDERDSHRSERHRHRDDDDDSVESWNL
ncbi:MAG: Spy/CpxP family protein refolding chaperone [Variibacter sp.]